ncbi:alpha/beta hydrolase [Kutzneria sp. CA-103260]|uniref:alpha/beta hydrolase n=1 Tax=Kutzneria sp. CA-103260 TaxID=2802641 RepID=UPI001BAC851D|nr:alpha/beta hydrolase [Kutzneria sp. CA-103260]QUQ64998.1 Serine aminopeptidase, S33 [Kutzneria sp. CA-103260]
MNPALWLTAAWAATSTIAGIALYRTVIPRAAPLGTTPVDPTNRTSVTMADARGHGMSGGNHVGLGHLDQADYLGWLRRIVTTVGDQAQILLHGLSMGGATALMLSGNPQLPKQVTAVIDDCGYTSATAEFRHHLHQLAHVPRIFPGVAIASLLTRLRAGYRLRDVDARTAASRTTLPVLVIHGDADTYNPTWMGQQIHAAVRGPKQLWLAPAAGHGESFFLHRDDYEHQVKTFCGINNPVN